MREQIFELIDSYAGMWNADKSALSIKLEALMCYREVRAYVADYGGNLNSIATSIIKFLQSDYPESMITAAIEQLKSEQQ